MKKNEEGDLFQDIPKEQRAQALREHSYAIEEQDVKRYYSPDELAEFKDTLSTEMLALNELEGELKTIKDDFKAKMKPYVLAKQQLLFKLKYKYYENEEEVALLDDQANGLMLTYDMDGLFLESRKLHPEEKQTKLKTVDGTNN